MGRLFWKFFFTFWLALLVAGIGVGTAVWLRHNGWQDDSEQPRQPIAGGHVSFLAEVAERAIRDGGVSTLCNFLYQSHEARLPPIYVVDEKDQEILRRQLTPSPLQHARWLFLQVDYPDVIRMVPMNDGHRYLLFPQMLDQGEGSPPPAAPDQGLNVGEAPPHNNMPPRHGGPPPGSPPPPLLPILAGTFASLMFSAALAWYFAKPIRNLRKAFDSVAHGNLSTRVGALMGNRRDELSDLGRDFDYMAGHIYSLVHAQQRLLHDVSHELRSPLARIQAAIGLAQQQPEKVQATLERIERESQRISDLVGELLVLSRLEAGVSDGESQDFDIGGLLDDIIENARFEAAQDDISIRYEGLDTTLVKARGELLHRAIENVLRNAVQHCKKGGEVSVSARFDAGKRRLQLTVDDQGPGVAEADLSAIFEPFFRSGDRSKANSIGLGLAIAYRSIEAHGGTIRANNLPQGGLRVQIDIPFAE